MEGFWRDTALAEKSTFQHSSTTGVSQPLWLEGIGWPLLASVDAHIHVYIHIYYTKNPQNISLKNSSINFLPETFSGGKFYEKNSFSGLSTSTRNWRKHETTIATKNYLQKVHTLLVCTFYIQKIILMESQYTSILQSQYIRKTNVRRCKIWHDWSFIISSGLFFSQELLVSNKGHSGGTSELESGNSVGFSFFILVFSVLLLPFWSILELYIL